MALDNIERRVVYEGDGSQKDFPFSFVVFKDSDITVSRSIDENRDETVATTEYSVELSDDGTGTVHFVEAPAEGIRIAILSAVPETQPMKLTTYDGFDPEVLNDSADRIVALIQQLLEKVQRAVILSPTDPMSANTLRDRLFQAAKEALESAQSAEEALAACEQIRQLIQLYSWDIPHIVDSLRDVENYPYDGLFAVAGFGNAGGNGQNISNRYVKAEGSTELRTLGERFADVVNVRDFGAKGNGITDDTAAFKAAAKFAARGAIIYVPSGSYVLTETVPGMFITNGRVDTTQQLDLIDLNSYKTRGFVNSLSLGMIFTYPVPSDSSGTRFYLQGFCSDEERYVWLSLIISDNSKQKLVRFDTETGETVVKDFTTLHHANGLSYCDGKIYVATLSTPSISIHDAETLDQLSTFDPANSPTSGGAVAYDSFTQRFYYYASAAIHVYTKDWEYVKSIPWQWPEWTPETGQSMGAYKGMLFFSRSSFGNAPGRHDAILVYDTIKSQVVWHWMLAGSYGELESVSFFKGKLLLGFNDGSHEIPFHTAEFDRSKPLELSPSPEELAQLYRPYFGNLSQEAITLYVDASAIAPGDGSEQKPFNSLKRAIYCARQTSNVYRVILYLSGDLTKNPFEYIQGASRLFQLMPWTGKAEPTIPPLRIIDSVVRIGVVTVKGLDNYGGAVCSIHAENTELDIRGTKFDPSESTLTPASYVNLTRGRLMSLGMDFSLTGQKLPTRYVTCFTGAELILLASASSFIFPTEAASVPRFYTYGTVLTQYADCRGLIANNVYVGSKIASVFDSAGTGGEPTVNTAS